MGIIHQVLYGDKKVWVRPLNMFLGKKEIDGKEMYRFEEINDMKIF